MVIAYRDKKVVGVFVAFSLRRFTSILLEVEEKSNEFFLNEPSN
jgi:hypothetical protein